MDYRVALALAAATRLTPSLSQAQPSPGGYRHGPGPFMERLGSIDADGDGVLTGEEVAAAEATRFAEADADGNGAASREEYLEAVLAERRACASNVFDRLDTAGYGVLREAALSVVQVRMFAPLPRDASEERRVGQGGDSTCWTPVEK